MKSRQSGKVAYSLYLWHWPLLIIAAGRSESLLTVSVRMELLGATLVLSAGSYYLLENAIRHAKLLARNVGLSLFCGLALAGSTIGYATYLLSVY